MERTEFPILKTLLLLGGNLVDLGRELYPLALWALLPCIWMAWWLWAVDWRKAFPALVQGSWVPLVLLAVVSALVWSRIAPSRCSCLGFVTLPNFWWQLGAVGLYVGLALLCGWLQFYFQWFPPEVNFEPPTGHDAGHHSHGHGHDAHAHDAHAHESAHASSDAGHAAHH